MEGLADRPRVVGAGRDRGHDVIHRDDVERALLARELGKGPAETVGPGDRAQKVIGAVELLGLAGLRVADHDRRPQDGRGDPVQQPLHPDLGLELGRLVVVLEVLPHDQLVLVDDAGAQAGHVGGADVGEMLELLRGEAELEHVAGALDVDLLGQLDGHGEVVDGRQVVDAPDLRRQVARSPRRRARGGGP